MQQKKAKLIVMANNTRGLITNKAQAVAYGVGYTSLSQMVYLLSIKYHMETIDLFPLIL